MKESLHMTSKSAFKTFVQTMVAINLGIRLQGKNWL